MSDQTTDPTIPDTPTDPPSLLLPIDEMQPLIIHARREMTLAGTDDATASAYLQAIQGFLNLALPNETAIPEITKLLNTENLTPLTNDPSEWEHDDVFWWSTRNMNAYSRDGGKTYFILGDQSVKPTVTKAN